MGHGRNRAKLASQSPVQQAHEAKCRQCGLIDSHQHLLECKHAPTYCYSSKCTHRTSRNCPQIAEYTLRLGSKVIPSKAPQSSPEFFVELLKAIGSVSDINHECMIDLDNYDVPISIVNVENTAIAASSSSSSFMVGVDLETYSNDDKSSIFASWNSRNEDIFFQLQFSGLVANTEVRTDTYALYDSVIVCEGGIASVRF
jgi:hypothetical protein